MSSFSEEGSACSHPPRVPGTFAMRNPRAGSPNLFPDVSIGSANSWAGVGGHIPLGSSFPQPLLLMAVIVTSEGTGGSAKGAAGSGLAVLQRFVRLHCASCTIVTFSPPKKTKRQYLEMSLCFQLNFLSEYWKRRNLPDGQKNTTTQTQNKQRKDKERGWKQGMLEHFSTSKGPIWHSDHWLFPAFTTMVVAKSVLCKQHLP